MALAFPAYSPKRTQPEPGKSDCEANGNHYAAEAGLPGMIFPILFHASARKTESHHEENDSCNFEPELVGGASEGASGGAHPAHDRAQRAVAAGLLSSHPCHSADLS